MTYAKAITIGVVLFAGTIAGLSSCSTVDAGEVGLYNRYGQISEQTLSPGGPYFANPITTNIEKMSIASSPWKAETPSFTKDLQTATVSFTLIYRLDPARAVNIRRYFGPGDGWRESIVRPITESSIKNIFALYTAMDAVAKRPVIQTRITQMVKERLAARGVIVDGFELTNLDYSDQFEAAVERAQVATQNAVAARNQTVTVREEAIQTQIRAEAEANKVRVVAEAITTNPAIVEMRKIERWNGQLCPKGATTCIIGGGPTPMIALNK